MRMRFDLRFAHHCEQQRKAQFGSSLLATLRSAQLSARPTDDDDDDDNDAVYSDRDLMTNLVLGKPRRGEFGRVLSIAVVIVEEFDNASAGVLRVL